MTGRRRRPRFGVLLRPAHDPAHDQTQQLEQQLELAEHADRLGLDEFWWGGHDDGPPLLADPMLMIARAAATTHRIRLGAIATGADQPGVLVRRAIQLDHLARGRMMLALGAGAAVTRTQDALAEQVDAMVRMLDGDGSASFLPPLAGRGARDGREPVAPYEDLLDLRVVSTGRPGAARLAGRTGLGVLVTEAAAPARPWRPNPLADDREQAAAASRPSRPVTPERWSVAVPMHLAPTEAQARHQVRRALVRDVLRIRERIGPETRIGDDPDALIDALHAGGHAVVGTPTMAAEHLERLTEQSDELGTVLVEVAGWASVADTATSLQLLACEVGPRLRPVGPVLSDGSPRREGDVDPGLRHRPARHASDARPVDHVPTPPAGTRQPPAPVGGPSRSPLERVADAAAHHSPTPARGLVVPARRGRHASD